MAETKKIRCSVCKWEEKTGRRIDTAHTPEWWANEAEIHRTTITRHLGHAPTSTTSPAPENSPGASKDKKENGDLEFTERADRVYDISDWLERMRRDGQNPDDYTHSIGHSVWGMQPRDGALVTLYSNRFSATLKPSAKKEKAGPAWPVIQRAAPVLIESRAAVNTAPRLAGLKLAAKCADHQIGFRALPDGTYEEFHDLEVMALFIEVVRLYQPDKIQILGDFLDLAAQSRWPQEAGFARTTQMSLDAAHRFLAELRAAAPKAEIVIIEGNHDKRMQTFVETNALAAFGLKRADMPDSWPVMSLPYLLRLDELNVEYVDAYPAATNWDNAKTRNIHGTKANSKGSTTAQYVHQTPNLNTWAGHTHRAEITYHTAIGDHGQPIESYSANPGCMCKTDGTAPSVHGAIGMNGVSAKVVEDWQNALGFLYYNETEGWPAVHIIKNGSVLIGDKLISVR